MNHKGKIAMIAFAALSAGGLSLLWAADAPLSYRAVSGSFDGASVAEKVDADATESTLATEPGGDYRLSAVPPSQWR